MPKSVYFGTTDYKPPTPYVPPTVEYSPPPLPARPSIDLSKYTLPAVKYEPTPIRPSADPLAFTPEAGGDLHIRKEQYDTVQHSFDFEPNASPVLSREPSYIPPPKPYLPPVDTYVPPTPQPFVPYVAPIQQVTVKEDNSFFNSLMGWMPQKVQKESVDTKPDEPFMIVKWRTSGQEVMRVNTPSPLKGTSQPHRAVSTFMASEPHKELSSKVSNYIATEQPHKKVLEHVANYVLPPKRDITPSADGTVYSQFTSAPPSPSAKPYRTPSYSSSPAPTYVQQSYSYVPPPKPSTSFFGLVHFSCNAYICSMIDHIICFVRPKLRRTNCQTGAAQALSKAH